jgi:uncharacterized RmlC-like cupin family protein
MAEHKVEEPTVHVIKPQEFDRNTAQTPGMQRTAAVSGALAGSQGIWAGVTVIEPQTTSGVHHHGKLETIIYIISGKIVMRWGKHMEFEREAEAGDFVYVPPFAPHKETNNSPDTPSHWVVVRNAQEAIVVDLEPFNAEK